jgi:ubiquinone biosynthesis accessory factor UbiK
MTAKFFETFSKQFSEALPPPLREWQMQFKTQFQQALEITFEKLNLVTREEFEVQTELLLRTRKKVEQLEKRVSLLETKETLNPGFPLSRE